MTDNGQISIRNAHLYIGSDKNAYDEESNMIVMLRRIFFYDDKHRCDSNDLSELKIRLSHHIPQHMQEKGTDFKNIFQELTKDGKIKLGNYDFLHKAFSDINKQKAAKTIKLYESKIAEILNQGSNLENKTSMMSKKLKKTDLESRKDTSTFVNQRSDSNVSSSASGFCEVEAAMPSTPSMGENTGIQSLRSIMQQFDEGEVEHYCKTFQEQMERKYKNTESVTQYVLDKKQN